MFGFGFVWSCDQALAGLQSRLLLQGLAKKFVWCRVYKDFRGKVRFGKRVWDLGVVRGVCCEVRILQFPTPCVFKRGTPWLSAQAVECILVFQRGMFPLILTVLSRDYNRVGIL